MNIRFVRHLRNLRLLFLRFNSSCTNSRANAAARGLIVIVLARCNYLSIFSTTIEDYQEIASFNFTELFDPIFKIECYVLMEVCIGHDLGFVVLHETMSADIHYNQCLCLILFVCTEMPFGVAENFTESN